MIEYHLDYDDAAWLPVPAHDDADWPEQVVGHYARGLGAMDEGLADALRRVAASAAVVRTELTGQLLLFCPPALAPAIGVVGVQVLQADGDIDLDAAVFDDPAALLVPAVETVEHPYWGRGRRAAVVVDSSPDTQGGRFNYAFRRGDTLLLATAIADTIPYATVMRAYSDRLVTSVRLDGE